MNVEQFIVQGGDNYNYLLFSEKSTEAVVVDPLEPERMETLADELGVTITHILITHGHTDHTGGAKALAEATGARIIGHQDISVVQDSIGHKEKRLCGALEVESLHTPGHTHDSICYLVHGHLFTGDTIFFAGAGNCHSGSVDDLYTSFSNILTKLPDETKLHMGHEYAARNLEFVQSIEPDNKAITKTLETVTHGTVPISTIGDERTYNPFFRYQNEEYVEALERHMGAVITDPKEVFVVTRELRNRW